jgi:hypothetical protein
MTDDNSEVGLNGASAFRRVFHTLNFVDVAMNERVS